MYGLMLRESRKAFQRETLISFIHTNRTKDYESPRRQTGTTIINLNVTNSITIDSDRPCKFSVQQQVEGEIVMDNVDEGAADSDASGSRGQFSRSSPGGSTPSSGKSVNKLESNDLNRPKSCPRLTQKRLSNTHSFSIHGTILIMLFCFFIRSVPWIPQILAPHIYIPESANLPMVEGMTLLQCVGIAACPYIFILTSTSKIRRLLHTVSMALMNAITTTTGSKKQSRVSPANSCD
ncbi:uncharacterized protein LOC134825022 [Bolinopsis microptera]|uniref:uncharacterized protein LOC134825022 n=1 Tax=Bolinopsis microptera TaxID=2820187 RepID=UPI003078BB11